MLSYQDQYEMCQKTAQDFTADALAFFKKNLNIGLHKVESQLGSFYTEEPYTDLTEAGVQSYPTPDQFVRLKIAYVTVDGVRNVLNEVFDEKQWQLLLSNQNNSTSDTATHIFIRRDRFEIYPKPTSAGNIITLICESGGRDLSFADYITGTITTLASGDTDVTGDSTIFTAAMIGRYFKINNFPVWYKIADVDSTTALVLDKEYQGASIVAGSETYVIGEMPRIPETTHQIPVWYALFMYYQGFKQNDTKAKRFENLFKGDLDLAKVTYNEPYSTNYIPGRRSMRTANPNDYPKNLTY